jgi:hypothetical protein
MAARGMEEMMSRISREEEDEASLWRKCHRRQRFRAVARRKSWGSRGGAKEREDAGENEVWNGWG